MEENDGRAHRSDEVSNDSSNQVLFTTGTAGTLTDEPLRDNAGSSKVKINIHSLDYGYNVKIGCQEFAVETIDKLIKNLEAYLKDPSGVERKWMNDKELL